MYKSGRYHQNADALSRLPVPGKGEPDENDDQVLMMDLMDVSPVCSAQIRKWTNHDTALSTVHEYILRGWPEKVEADAGMSRMKGLARSYMWWPGMDQDVERVVTECEICQSFRKAPTRAPLHPWEWPSSAWERLHIDYAGPFLGRMFLILVDSLLKWMEVYPVMHATSQITIEKLRMCFR